MRSLTKSRLNAKGAEIESRMPGPISTRLGDGDPKKKTKYFKARVSVACFQGSFVFSLHPVSDPHYLGRALLRFFLLRSLLILRCTSAQFFRAKDVFPRLFSPSLVRHGFPSSPPMRILFRRPSICQFHFFPPPFPYFLSSRVRCYKRVRPRRS